jgi:transcriptional regulator with XRE-family HTH domain
MPCLDLPFLNGWMLKEAFCTVIKDLRLEHKMTREKLAELSSLDSTTIYRIETAKKLPNTESIFRLAAAFGISTAALIEKVEEYLKK